MRRLSPPVEFALVMLAVCFFFVTAANIVGHFLEKNSIAIIPLVALMYTAPVTIILLLPQRRRLIRHNRVRRGQCLSCGYDIRASTGRCPECGAEIEEKREADSDQAGGMQ